MVFHIMGQVHRQIMGDDIRLETGWNDPFLSMNGRDLKWNRHFFWMKCNLRAE